MAYKKIQQIEAHDAAGYETAMEDFSGCDDGYGSRVEHGDLSMQRMIERGGRQPWHHKVEEEDLAAQTPHGYDTHPFQSRSQMRKFYAMEGRGELPSGTARRWAHKTKGGYKGLPEKV